MFEGKRGFLRLPLTWRPSVASFSSSCTYGVGVDTRGQEREEEEDAAVGDEGREEVPRPRHLVSAKPRHCGSPRLQRRRFGRLTPGSQRLSRLLGLCWSLKLDTPAPASYSR